MKAIIETVADEISKVLANVKEEEAIELSKKLQKAGRIFVYGEGRSGLMGKAFAMRLMHGGYHVYVIGETITPSIRKDDLLVTISGSGSTNSIVQYVTKAKEAGAEVFLVTTNAKAKIVPLCEGVLLIPAATKYRLPDEPETIQPLGNQFDQSVHLVLDAIIIHSLQAASLANDTFRERHANLE